MAKRVKFAFPSGDFRSVEPTGGMTLREYYAGLAMEGLIKSCSLVYNHNLQEQIKPYAEVCRAWADTLAAEMEKETPSDKEN